ncbi:MAG TPA: sulfurtransferase TusA family protein [Candidatus Lokiarchaeia archaeon]|nr:sulfurtransferase TusA family protein [Candidatus Lokiarchaeia archaeon]
MAENPPGTEPDETLDLTGKICPMTFVYTKLVLEKMEVGQILKVILDHPPAFTNVPESVARQNLGKILDKDETGQVRAFWIKKI